MSHKIGNTGCASGEVNRGEMPYEKIGIVELGTKAIKLLLGEPGERFDDFNFNRFKNFSVLTNTGSCLNEENSLEYATYKNSLSPAIAKALEIASKYGASKIVAVATAVFRKAANRAQIIEWIKADHSISVEIITPEKEALAVYDALIYSGAKLGVNKGDPIAIIDQGGGSTEISIFGEGGLEYLQTLDFGTVTLKEYVSASIAAGYTLEKSLALSDRKIKLELEAFSKAPAYKNVKKFVAVGTAVTKATDLLSSSRQHGFAFAGPMIEEKIERLSKMLLAAEEEFFLMLKEPNAAKKSRLDSIITMRLGLPLFLIIMKKFGAERLLVSGTGLRYGIFCAHMNAKL